MSWDIHSKSLLRECPQDFVSYLVPGARYVGMREAQLQTRVDDHFDPREIRGDHMIEAELSGVPFLIDVEWQSTKNEDMDERLLGYSYEATRLHKLYVLSCVIYTKSVTNVPQPPLIRDIPSGFRSIWFNFISVELAEKSLEEFRQLDLDGFRPLMPLCKDGATHEVLEEVLEHLVSKKKGNLVSITKFFAGMAFTSENDTVWLQRRFKMLDEFLWENSWTYRETVQQGIEQGIKQGRVEEAHKHIEVIVQVRFPNLLALTANRLAPLTDLAKLQELLITAATASTAEVVEQSLLALPCSSEQTKA